MAQEHYGVVTARNPADVKDVIADFPETAMAIKLDVTEATNIATAVRLAVERFGRIDVLINNAGIGNFAAVEESEEDQVRRMFEIIFSAWQK